MRDPAGDGSQIRIDTDLSTEGSLDRGSLAKHLDDELRVPRRVRQIQTRGAECLVDLDELVRRDRRQVRPTGGLSPRVRCSTTALGETVLARARGELSRR